MQKKLLDLLLSVGKQAGDKFTFWFGWSDVSLQFISFIWSLCYSRVDRFIALKWTQGRVRGSQRKVHSRQVEEGSRLTQPVVNFPNTLAITCYHCFKVVSTSQEIMRRSQRKVHSRQIKKVDITCNQLPQPISVKSSFLRVYLL